MGSGKKIISSPHFPYIMLTAAVVVWFVCINLFQDGMFIDGIQYAAIARNLARGVGTFWNPVLAQNSVAGLNSFHEHPPLVFFIQSLFFRIFGLHNIYPERLYCLFTFLVTSLFIALIWRTVFKNYPSRQLWWLPVLMWAIMPIVFWACINDIQENTMTVFTTAAVYFFLRAVNSKSVFRTTGFYLGCISILLAAFCKGVPGVFPVVFFFIYWLTVRGIKTGQAIVYSAGIGFILATAAWIILQNPVAKQALHIWFFDRMLHRISSDPTESSHFYILQGLLIEQLPALILAILALAGYKYCRIKNEIRKGYFMLFLLLGFAASLPLMLTLVQRNFYFVPALPMFAVAWALLITDGLNIVVIRIENRPGWRNALAVFAVAALIAGIITTICFSGRIKRDKAVLQDVYSIRQQVPPDSFASVTSDIMWMDWSFRCYMMRYDEISFSDKDTCNYFIGRLNDPVSDKYVKTGPPLNVYVLYRRK